MKKRTFNIFLNLNLNLGLIAKLNKLSSLLFLSALGICLCAEPTFAMDLKTQPDSTLPFTAEELKAASEISPEELMRQMAENAAEIEKLESEGKCSPSSDYDYDKIPRQKKSPSQKKIQKKTENSAGHKCDLCKKEFKQRSDLKKHIRIHTGEKPYVCSTCKKAFTQNCNLQTHERIHTGEKPFECSKCKKTFRQEQHLRSHERTHTGEKPFACEACGKKFGDQSNLQKHKRTHSGEKPHGCPHVGCKSAFSQSGNRNKHMKICPNRPDAPAGAADKSPGKASETESDMEAGT